MQTLVCQCIMLTVLWCFAGSSSWFHLKFYPSVVHEKCSCTNCIEITSAFQSCFLSGFTVLEVLYPSGLALWIWGSLGLHELFCFPLPKMRRKKLSHYSMAKSPENFHYLNWECPRALSLFWKGLEELCSLSQALALLFQRCIWGSYVRLRIKAWRFAC